MAGVRSLFVDNDLTVLKDKSMRSISPITADEKLTLCGMRQGIAFALYTHYKQENHQEANDLEDATLSKVLGKPVNTVRNARQALIKEGLVHKSKPTGNRITWVFGRFDVEIYKLFGSTKRIYNHKAYLELRKMFKVELAKAYKETDDSLRKEALSGVVQSMVNTYDQDPNQFS